MNELHASFTSLLASLAAFDATIKEANVTFRAALHLDGPPVPTTEAQSAEAPALALPIVEDDQPATPPVHVEATPPVPTTTSPTGADGKSAVTADLLPVEVPAPASVEVPVPAEGPGVAQDATVPETTNGPTTMPTTPPATEEAGQGEETTDRPTVPALVGAGTSNNGTGRPSGRGSRRGK